MKNICKAVAVILAELLVTGLAGVMMTSAMPAPGPDMWGNTQQPANTVSILYVNPINDYINVRSQPAHNSALVDTVNLFECMFFTGEAGTGFGSDNVMHFWYKIRTPREIVGWVRDDLISIVPQNMGTSYVGDWGSGMILYVNPINDYINMRM